jgi:hypothetical protein
VVDCRRNVAGARRWRHSEGHGSPRKELLTFAGQKKPAPQILAEVDFSAFEQRQNVAATGPPSYHRGVGPYDRVPAALEAARTVDLMQQFWT